MSVGNAVVGAVLGAAVGAAANVGLEYYSGATASWFPLVTGALAGLGVRKLDPTVTTTASYLRGGLAALIGLAGIYGGIHFSSQAQLTKLAEASAPIDRQIQETVTEPAGEEGGDDATEAAEEPAEEAPAVEAAPAPVAASSSGGNRNAKPREFSLWDFVFIGLGTFFAYEFARGSAPAEPAAGSDDTPEGDAPGDAPTDEPPSEDESTQPA